MLEVDCSLYYASMKYEEQNKSLMIFWYALIIEKQGRKRLKSIDSSLESKKNLLYQLPISMNSFLPWLVSTLE